jgi:hypothetical protein
MQRHTCANLLQHSRLFGHLRVDAPLPQGIRRGEAPDTPPMIATCSVRLVVGSRRLFQPALDGPSSTKSDEARAAVEHASGRPTGC